MATTITVIPSMKKLTISKRSFEVFHSLVIPFYTANLINNTKMIIIAE
jgi:hypothetical protein